MNGQDLPKRLLEKQYSIEQNIDGPGMIRYIGNSMKAVCGFGLLMISTLTISIIDHNSWPWFAFASMASMVLSIIVLYWVRKDLATLYDRGELVWSSGKR